MFPMSSDVPSFSSGPIRDMSCLLSEIWRKKADNEPFTKLSLGACGQQSTESPCPIGINPTSATTLYYCLGGLDQLQGPNRKSKMKVLLVLDFKLKDLD